MRHEQHRDDGRDSDDPGGDHGQVVDDREGQPGLVEPARLEDHDDTRDQHGRRDGRPRHQQRATHEHEDVDDQQQQADPVDRLRVVEHTVGRTRFHRRQSHKGAIELLDNSGLMSVLVPPPIATRSPSSSPRALLLIPGTTTPRPKRLVSP